MTQYRTYDPVVGRWLSRDPFAEPSDPAANLYRYANGNPISLNDPSGRFGLAGAAIGALAGGLGNLAWQLYQNGGKFGCINSGQVIASAALGGLFGATLGLAAEALAVEEVTTVGTSSLYDTSITRAGSQYLNVQTDVSAAEFQQNLISNGYDVVKQSQSATILNNGTNTWAIYTRTSTEASGAQFFGGNGSIVKYSLGGP